ncbi:transposase [Nesterenkonia muleiensis]|uniref:transposase n=1 Tax=Nesterenkonia muleiensis TaxID=2282648 RepID=UPI000E7342AC|nr:transposase [Nesterenkonia muleiensis]
MVRYSDDFRRDVIAARRQGHETTAQVARQYGIAPGTLKSWMDKFYAENPQELEADNQTLREEHARLLAEQEELKKQFKWSSR